MPSLFIVVDLLVAVNNAKRMSLVLEKQHLLPFAIFCSYKIIRTAVSNIHVLKSSCKLSDIIVLF